MEIEMKDNASIMIGGHTFTGKNIKLDEKNIIVDDVTQEEKVDEREIVIHVNGDVESITTDSGDVHARQVGTITSESGDVACGDVSGDVTSSYGDISCGKVGGDVSSNAGDVSYKK